MAFPLEKQKRRYSPFTHSHPDGPLILVASWVIYLQKLEPVYLARYVYQCISRSLICLLSNEVAPCGY